MTVYAKGSTDRQKITPQSSLFPLVEGIRAAGQLTCMMCGYTLMESRKKTPSYSLSINFYFWEFPQELFFR